MSTVSSSTPTGSITSAVATQTAATNAAVQQAAQSLISGATGNTSMDVSNLVTAIVNAKVAGQSAALVAEQTLDNTQISAYGTLSSALSALQAGLTSLSNGTTVNQFTATASGGASGGLTGTAASGAVAGSYAVNVQQVATAQVLTSQAFSPATKQLGTGTMTLSVGGAQSTISINTSNNTVAGIAAAINSAKDNPGISATVVTGTDGAHLVLHSTATGSQNAISISVSDPTASDALNSLAVTSGKGTSLDTTVDAAALKANQSTITNGAADSTTTPPTLGWTQTTAAQDAYFTIDGTGASSSTNTVSSAMSGVTLNLTSAAVGSTQTLTVAQDTTSQSTAINNFVNLYNTLVTTMGTLTKYDSTASSQGPLLGDSTLNLIKNTLASIVSNGVKGSNGKSTSLATIGITLQADGSLAVDSTTLNNALQSNQSTIATLFNSTNGVAAQLNNSITSYISSSGTLAARTTALNADLADVATKQTALTAYTKQITDQYNAQFTALNTLMATMNNNQTYLTALFGGQNSAGTLASNKN